MPEVDYKDIPTLWTSYVKTVEPVLDDLERKMKLSAQNAAKTDASRGEMIEIVKEEVAQMTKFAAAKGDEKASRKVVKSNPGEYLEDILEEMLKLAEDKRAKFVKDKLDSEKKRLERVLEPDKQKGEWISTLQAGEKSIKEVRKALATLPPLDTPAGEVVALIDKAVPLFRNCAKAPGMTQDKFIAIKEKMLKEIGKPVPRMAGYEKAAGNIKVAEIAMKDLFAGLAPAGFKPPSEAWSGEIYTMGQNALREIKRQLNQVGIIFNQLLNDMWQAQGVSDAATGPSKEGPKIGRRGAT